VYVGKGGERTRGKEKGEWGKDEWRGTTEKTRKCLGGGQRGQTMGVFGGDRVVGVEKKSLQWGSVWGKGKGAGGRLFWSEGGGKKENLETVGH